MHWYEKLQKSAIILILANSITIYGALFLDWEVFPLLMLFWAENVIIGCYNVLRILTSNPQSTTNLGAKLFLAPFFTVHYGIFCFAHGIFLVVLFGKGDAVQASGINVSLLWRTLTENGLFIGVLALLGSHGYSFIFNYLRKGEYQKINAYELMFRPYGRLILLHILIIGGGFLVMTLGLDLAGIIVLVLLKISVDVRAHIKEHEISKERKYEFKDN